MLSPRTPGAPVRSSSASIASRQSGSGTQCASVMKTYSPRASRAPRWKSSYSLAPGRVTHQSPGRSSGRTAASRSTSSPGARAMTSWVPSGALWPEVHARTQLTPTSRPSCSGRITEMRGAAEAT